MRPARLKDLAAIGQVQSATMLASLEAGHTAEHGAPLPEGVRAMIAAPVAVASEVRCHDRAVRSGCAPRGADLASSVIVSRPPRRRRGRPRRRARHR